MVIDNSDTTTLVMFDKEAYGLFNKSCSAVLQENNGGIIMKHGLKISTQFVNKLPLIHIINNFYNVINFRLMMSSLLHWLDCSTRHCFLRLKPRQILTEGLNRIFE